MIRGTTPTYTLQIDGYDLTGCSVYVTVKRSRTTVTKTSMEGAVVIAADEQGTTLLVWFSQEDTLALRAGDGSIQVRWIDRDGTAWATEIANVSVGTVLLDSVIEWEGEEGGVRISSATVSRFRSPRTTPSLWRWSVLP